METLLRAALIGWLRTDPALGAINIVAEEAAPAASPPWLGIAASASTDWSTKDRQGREIRIALELHFRGDDPATAAGIIRAVESRIEAMPRAQGGWRIATRLFLRGRAERRARNLRAMLIEYRFRVLAAT